VTADPTTASHEARHAAAALLLDLPITRASARPWGDSWGHVVVDLDPDRLREHALMVMAGALGDAGWPPDRPPDAEWQTKDAYQLDVLAKALELDQAGWHKLTADVWNLAADTRFERLELALTMLLERGHVLDKNTLTQVAAPEREQRKPAAGVKSRPPVQIATFAA
jgi:hypothetical protein